MKTMFFIACLFLVYVPIQAQEYFLPVSSENNEAIQAYKNGIYAINHANVPEFKTQMKKAIELDPEFFTAYALRSLYGPENYEMAMSDIDKALAIPESRLTDSEKILRKGMLEVKKNPEANLEFMIDELIAAYPDNAQAHHVAMINYYFIDQNDQKAVEHAKKHAELSPKRYGAYNMLGYAYMRAGDMKSAKKAFQTYIKNSPNEANAYDSMGEYYMVAEAYKKSAKNYQRATEMGMETSRERAEKAKAKVK